MIPNQTFISYPVFGDNASKVQPDAAKYSAGFQQADVLPAEWMNWAWNKNTQGITDLNKGMASVEAELNNVVTAGGGTPAEATSNQVITAIQALIAQAKAEAILAAHPVGSIYWTDTNENPATTFGGGTWVRIKDKFILAAGDTYTNGGTGGSATVTLTTQQIPSHTHTFTGTEHTHVFTGSAVTSGANSRGHTHNVTASGSISGGAYTFTGSAVTSGGSSSANTGSESSHTHSTTVKFGDTNGKSVIRNVYFRNGQDVVGNGAFSVSDNIEKWSKTGTNQEIFTERAVTLTLNSSFTSGAGSSHSHTMAHTHSVTASGTISVKTNPSFTGSAVTSGAESQNHTHSVTASGTNAKTTAGGTNSNTGGGQAHSNMPPYEVHYCWKRTA